MLINKCYKARDLLSNGSAVALWHRGECRLFAVTQEVVVTPTRLLRLAWDFTRPLGFVSGGQVGANEDPHSPRRLVATRSAPYGTDDVRQSRATWPPLGGRRGGRSLALGGAWECEGPFNAACSFNYFFFYPMIAFLRAWTYSKSPRILHTRHVWWKIRYFMVITKGRDKMAQRRPLTVFKIKAPCFNFVRSVRILVHICSTPRRTKKPLGPMP